MILLDIGVAASDQLLDDCTHLGDMFGRARLDGRTQAAERIDVGMKLLFCFFGDFADRLVQRKSRKVPCRAIVDLVIDVGDVADVFDVISAVEVPQQAE